MNEVPPLFHRVDSHLLVTAEDRRLQGLFGHPLTRNFTPENLTPPGRTQNRGFVANTCPLGGYVESTL